MATNLLKQPETKTALYSDWTFELELTDTGDASTEIRLAYKLVDVATGNEIVPLSSIKVVADGGKVSLNFKRQISRYVNTPVFNIQSGTFFIGANWEPYQKVEVQLHYGDVIFFKDEDPCFSNVNLSKQSNQITFYNWAERGDGDLTAETWMNTKAEHLYWCKGFPDYISAMKAGVMPFIVKDIYGTVATGDLFKSINEEQNVQILFAEYDTDGDGNDEKVDSLTYYIDGEPTTYTYENCCCDGNLQAAVLFLDPRGGRNVMPFGCVQQAGTSIEQTIACLEDYRVEEDIVSFHYLTPESAFMDRITHKKTFETFQLETHQPSTKRNREFFRNFYAAKEHHLLLRVEGTNDIFILPAILESGGATYTDEEGDVRVSANLRTSQPVPIQIA